MKAKKELFKSISRKLEMYEIGFHVVEEMAQARREGMETVRNIIEKVRKGEHKGLLEGSKWQIDPKYYTPEYYRIIGYDETGEMIILRNIGGYERLSMIDPCSIIFGNYQFIDEVPEVAEE